MADYKKRTPIEFKFDVPEIITLEVDPNKAPITKKGDSWSYFTTNEGIFWAKKDLHFKLMGFNKGDTVEITMKYVNKQVDWDVKKGKAQQSLPSGDMMIRKIYQDVQKIKQALNIENGEETNRLPDTDTGEEASGDEGTEELGF